MMRGYPWWVHVLGGLLGGLSMIVLLTAYLDWLITNEADEVS